MMFDLIWVPLATLGGAAITVSALYVRMRRKFAQQISAKKVAKKLLNSDKYQKRSFEAIKSRIDRFDDNELRKILLAVGAVKFTSTNGEELWGWRSAGG